MSVTINDINGTESNNFQSIITLKFATLCGEFRNTASLRFYIAFYNVLIYK